MTEYEAPDGNEALVLARSVGTPRGGRIVVALLGMLAALIAGALYAAAFAPSAWPRYAEFLWLTLPGVAALSAFASCCWLLDERKRRAAPRASWAAPNGSAAGERRRPRLRLVGGTDFSPDAERRTRRRRGAPDELSIVFSGEALAGLRDMAARRDASVEDVVGHALSLERWYQGVYDRGGAVVAREPGGSLSEPHVEGNPAQRATPPPQPSLWRRLLLRVLS